LALGERLADDIGATEKRNTTGKWIAHHLAEKLEAAKKDSSLEPECVDLILKLWASRRDFPKGDPFARYDQLLAPLERLFRAEQRYFPGFQNDTEIKDSTQKWLDAAVRLDRLSSFLIAQCLKIAVRNMDDKEEELLQLAQAIEKDPQLELIETLRDFGVDDGVEADKSKDPFMDHIEELRALLTEMDTFKQVDKKSS